MRTLRALPPISVQTAAFGHHGPSCVGESLGGGSGSRRVHGRTQDAQPDYLRGELQVFCTGDSRRGLTYHGGGWGVKRLHPCKLAGRFFHNGATFCLVPWWFFLVIVGHLRVCAVTGIGQRFSALRHTPLRLLGGCYARCADSQSRCVSMASLVY